jgi:hypothetical protein
VKIGGVESGTSGGSCQLRQEVRVLRWGWDGEGRWNCINLEKAAAGHGEDHVCA